jgi:hypothetical protein
MKLKLSQWFLHHWDSSTIGYLLKADYAINCSRIKPLITYIFCNNIINIEQPSDSHFMSLLTWTVNLSEVSIFFLESSGNIVSYYKISPKKSIMRQQLYHRVSSMARNLVYPWWYVLHEGNFTSQHDNIGVVEGAAILYLGYLLDSERKMHDGTHNQSTACLDKHSTFNHQHHMQNC